MYVCAKIMCVQKCKMRLCCQNTVFRWKIAFWLYLLSKTNLGFFLNNLHKMARKTKPRVEKIVFLFPSISLWTFQHTKTNIVKM